MRTETHIPFCALPARSAIIFFNLLSTIPVAYFSTWGPATGMRQLALSRYGFGYWTVMIPVVLNCIACLGWSTINTIVGWVSRNSRTGRTTISTETD